MARLNLDLGDREGALTHAREARYLAPADLSIATVTAVVMVAADPGGGGRGNAGHSPASGPPGRSRTARRLWVALGKAWHHLGEPDKAAKAWQAALDLDMADPARCPARCWRIWRGPGGRTSLPPAFVRALFDTYADRFDRELVGTLRYDAPQAIRQLLLDQAVPAGGRGAGCRVRHRAGRSGRP